MAQSSRAHRAQNDPLLEVCVDTPEGLKMAIEAGADRIELCSALATGGVTPSQGFMALAARTSPIPVHALIRPRSGDFVFSEEEITLMQHDSEAARDAGLAGVVIGASREDGRLDLSALKALMQAAGPLDITLHRAFDMVPDFTEALEQVFSLGIRRILTSGGAPTALAGLEVLQRLIEQAGNRLSIMPGGGINADTVAPFLKLGIREIHASCSSPRPHAGKVADLGFVLPSDRQTDAQKVKALKAALAR
nr:copper homeostasis protein CutC [uncultured Cohaesibacter sp.]